MAIGIQTNLYFYPITGNSGNANDGWNFNFQCLMQRIPHIRTPKLRDPCSSSQEFLNLPKLVCLGCAKMKYLSVRKADRALQLLFALTHTLARMHNDCPPFHAIPEVDMKPLHSWTIQTPLWENSHTNIYLLSGQSNLNPKLIRALAKTKRRKTHYNLVLSKTIAALCLTLLTH